MRKGFLIYEEIRKYLVYIRMPLGIYDLWLWTWSLLKFLVYEENFLIFFNSASAWNYWFFLPPLLWWLYDIHRPSLPPLTIFCTFATFDIILCTQKRSFVLVLVPRKLQSLSHPSPTWKTSSCSSGTSWRTAALCRLCAGYEVIFLFAKNQLSRQKISQRKVLICVLVIIRQFYDILNFL